MRHFFYSFITFFIALFFIVIGIACMLIPWINVIESAVIQFLIQNTVAIFLFGFAFFIIGCSFIGQVILSSKRKYYYVRSGSNAVSVDENLIQECLATYWKAKFPKEEIPFNLILKDNKIHITVDLPYVAKEQQLMTIERIENDISHIFASTLGYRNEFFLNVSFKKHQ